MNSTGSSSAGPGHAPTTPGLSDRVSMRRMTQKKRSIWRSIVMFVVVTAAIVYLAMLQRDAQSRRWAERNMNDIAAGLRKLRAETGALPERMPTVERFRSEEWSRYYLNPAYARRNDTQATVGVCCPREPLRLYLGKPGRFVTLLRGGEFEVVWMPEAEFCERAAPLGFGAVVPG